MDYKEKATILRVCSSKKGEQCSHCPAFGQGSRVCMRNAMKDGAQAITDLLARAETSEERCKELEERCKRLNEARERANEAAAKWESMYHVALERAEKEAIARKQGNVMVCPVCQGRGRVQTSFYGYGNCLMEDVRNDKFPPVCHTCKGKGIIEVKELMGVE